MLGPCLVHFIVCKQLAEEERATCICITLIVYLIYCDFGCSVALLRGPIDWSGSV